MGTVGGETVRYWQQYYQTQQLQQQGPWALSAKAAALGHDEGLVSFNDHGLKSAKLLCEPATAAALVEAALRATTYFHSYSYVPAGGAAAPSAPQAHHHQQPLHQHQLHQNSFGQLALHQQQHQAQQHHHHQQSCNLPCSCACSCAANIVSQQPPQALGHHLAYTAQHHHRAAAATATVLLQPVERVKDTMVSEPCLVSLVFPTARAPETLLALSVYPLVSSPPTYSPNAVLALHFSLSSCSSRCIY